MPKRLRSNKAEGKTPAIGDGQAWALLAAPPADTLKGKRDRVILATFLFHGLRCIELCQLKVRDLHLRRGVLHLRVYGKGCKTRYIPAHPVALEKVKGVCVTAAADLSHPRIHAPALLSI